MPYIEVGGVKIDKKPCGAYGTNCYIVAAKGGEVVVDPGMGAAQWIEQRCQKVLAVFLTHGHFDHTFDAAAVKKRWGCEIICPKNDAFLCQNDPFGILKEPFSPDILAGDGDIFSYGGADFIYRIFPGHTPGCAVIESDAKSLGSQNSRTMWFCGDFLFKGSVGRWDFEFSDATQMRASLARVFKEQRDIFLMPGHGDTTTIQAEKSTIEYMLSVV